MLFSWCPPPRWSPRIKWPDGQVAQQVAQNAKWSIVLSSPLTAVPSLAGYINPIWTCKLSKILPFLTELLFIYSQFP